MSDNYTVAERGEYLIISRTGDGLCWIVAVDDMTNPHINIFTPCATMERAEETVREYQLDAKSARFDERG